MMSREQKSRWVAILLILLAVAGMLAWHARGAYAQSNGIRGEISGRWQVTAIVLGVEDAKSGNSPLNEASVRVEKDGRFGEAMVSFVQSSPSQFAFTIQAQAAASQAGDTVIAGGLVDGSRSAWSGPRTRLK